MKLLPFFVLLAAAAFSGCGTSSPDPFAGGRDARVYNAQTGRYEWPDDRGSGNANRRRNRSQAVSSTMRDDAGAGGKETSGGSGERVYNPRTQRYEWPSSQPMQSGIPAQQQGPGW